MITALIGIQTTCIVAATSYAIKHFKSKKTNMILHSKSNGFKHFKTF